MSCNIARASKKSERQIGLCQGHYGNTIFQMSHDKN